MYIEWFEEGLCQWYSLKIYYEMTKNLDILRLYQQRAYIYSKIKDEHNFTKRYYEYMKLFARLYLAGGEKLIGKMLIDYMANQREDVNKYLETDNLKMKNLPKDEIDSYLVNFTFCVEPEKLHPLEYLILRELLSPKSLEELLVKIKAPQNVINQALVELNLKGMIVGKNEKIEINWRKKDLFDRKLIMPYWPL
jgi:hypothetical protein